MSAIARAMVFHGSGRPLELQWLPTPRLQPGEALVAVDLCTLCASDLHTHRGARSTPCPTVLGHEVMGRIAALGGEFPTTDVAGRPLTLGQRVTWSIAASCGECPCCRRGLPQKCDRLVKYGHAAIGDRHTLSGGLADYCHLIAGTAVVSVPDSLPDAVVCPANCATATSVAALRIARPEAESTVVIQGAGMLGLAAAAIARQRGLKTIVADVDARRLEWAVRFGAMETVNVAGDTGRLEKAVAEMTDGRGADAVLELSGAPEAAEAAVSLLRIGGCLVLVGAVFPTRPISLLPETIVRRMLRIEGLHNYSPADLVTAVDFLTAAHTRFPFAELVAGEYELADADAAFREAETSRPFRIGIRPRQG